MLNCKITKGFVEPGCDTTVSGIQAIAIASYDATHAATASGEGTDCPIDTLDLGEGIKFYNMPFLTNTASATDEVTINGSPDSKCFTHSVTFVAPKIDCDALAQWKNYALGTVVIAVLTKENVVEVYGWDNGLTASAMSYTTGAATGDQKGVTMTFDGAQKDPHFIVKDWSVIKALMQ